MEGKKKKKETLNLIALQLAKALRNEILCLLFQQRDFLLTLEVKKKPALLQGKLFV